MTTRLVVQRHDIRQTRWEETPPPDLGDGDVRMRIDTFALTSNNITYAAFGDLMNYWQFFPTGDPATGCVPTWGFATVAESRRAGVEQGEKFYGYYPIADEVVLTAGASDDTGFVDAAEHRRGLPPVYNRYVRCSTDPGYAAGLEAHQALFRPLFSTSFLLDDFLEENHFFGASTTILSSASSKTGYGTAFCLARRDVRVIGLTSTANLDFTRSLGCYDDVLTYDDIAALPEADSVYIDFSGQASVRAAVHERLGDRLTYDCAVGVTHWDAMSGGGTLPGPSPVFFFVPDWAAQRAQQWGQAGLLQRIGGAYSAFLKAVMRDDDPWLTVVTGKGRDAIDAVYTALLDGEVPAREGHILSV
ncbi:DUF2855 family protein [Mycolicibacterium sp. BiH015]|uniref:DUF2855 family protein n=1 Tax=Mycolicibacterium sp. BiH015 TaxID=3018808 RepID=UPI0022DE9B37|nr:DUF2855 family protein [Mycolicibacterium sp. BiH015]MDA2891875.1 DUF2855 family protein [Mycolicibacterium sp. BiH015]